MSINRGDTAYLMLDYTLNDEPLVEGAYQEIELQIKGGKGAVRKTLLEKEIEWATITYEDEETHEEKSFTGYVAHLSQKDTFKLDDGTISVQLRIMVGDEVGSSEISGVDLGQVLSNKVLVTYDTN